MSEEFQEILCTDPTTEDGEAKVVNYFDIADEWANVNRTAAIGAHERQVFDKLLWGLVTSTIFVDC